jgi:hypothetical protein
LLIRKHSKYQRTRTDVLLEEARKRKDDLGANKVINYIPELIRRWKCELPSCTNVDKQCLVFNKQHMPLNSSHLATWNNAIQEGKASIENPPLSVRPMEAKKRSQSTSSDVSQQSPMPLPHYYPSPLAPPPPYYPSHFVPTGTISHRQSSPISSDTDPYELVTEYIRWFKTRAPLQADILSKALEQLIEEHHDLANIKTMPESTWIRMDVPVGLGMRLSREVKKFERERKKRR